MLNHTNGFLVSKETVVLHQWESETKILFYQKKWGDKGWINYHCERFRKVTCGALADCHLLWRRANIQCQHSISLMVIINSTLINSFDKTKFFYHNITIDKLQRKEQREYLLEKMILNLVCVCSPIFGWSLLGQ